MLAVSSFALPPLVILAIGIATVIGMILVFRINAFIALITAAIVVSLLSPGATEAKISRVAVAFGENCGKIGIVIGLAAVIGQCMMDSGGADRIVRAFMRLLGEKRSPWALMGSGYVLAIPVFFDTVFYLLVPLARSFYRRTGRNYLKCLLAIAAGGAVTHTLVPPTPGPLAMAANLGIDLGTMIGVGAMVALPAAVVGLWFGGIVDRRMPIEMRQVGDQPEPEPLADSQLPSLWVALLPVVLPVLLITAHTVTEAGAKREMAAARDLIQESTATATPVNAVEAAVPAAAPAPPSEGPWQQAAHYTAILGDPNLALLLSMAIALVMLYQQRHPTLKEMEHTVEVSLMSAGVIILITAAGAAFGAMLKEAKIDEAIRQLFGDSQGTAAVLLGLGFVISVLLKVAQGSSTAAMIVTSSMMASFIQDLPLPFHAVYLATAIGSGSLVGSWMNDSGFWIFAKMGGLTETEALKSWTPLLAIMGLTGMVVTVILALVMPLKGL